MKYLLILLFLFSTHSSFSKEETVTVQDVKKYLKGIGSDKFETKFISEPIKIFCEYDDVRFNNKQYLNKDSICENDKCEEKLIIWEEHTKYTNDKYTNIKVSIANQPPKNADNIYVAKISNERIYLQSYKYVLGRGDGFGGVGHYEYDISRMSGKVHRRLVRYNENNPLCHLPNTDKHKIKLEEHWHNHILPDTISYACERKEINFFGKCSKNRKRKF